MIDKYFFPRANFKFVALFWSLFIQAPFVIAEPVKIGAMLCLTGSCASDGQAALNGMNLAIKELKLKGNPVEFELLIQDTAEAISGALAVTAYKALYSSGARIFVGPTWSSAGQALAPILARASDVVALTPSVGSPIFHLAGDNLFNLRGVDEQAIKQTAQIAWSLGVHRIAIFGSQQTWSAEQTESFEREFVSLGGEVVSKVEPLPGETDLKSFTLKLLLA